MDDLIDKNFKMIFCVHVLFIFRLHTTTIVRTMTMRQNLSPHLKWFCYYIMLQNKFSDSMTQWWQQLKRLSSFSHIYFCLILTFLFNSSSSSLDSNVNILLKLHASTLLFTFSFLFAMSHVREREWEKEIFNRFFSIYTLIHHMYYSYVDVVICILLNGFFLLLL